MLIFILGAALAAALFYYFFVKPMSYWKDRGVPQGKPYWIVGDTWRNLIRKESFADLAQYVYNQCPGTRYSGMYQFLLPTLVVRDPDLLKQVTVKDFDHFTDHMSFIPDGADSLWTKNLVSLKGQRWREMRSILSPSFTSSKMKNIFVLMAESAENFVQYFLNKNDDMVKVEMKDAFTRFTNDVIATTAFGITVDSLGEPNNEFYLMGKKATDFSGIWKNIKFIGYFLFPKIYSLFKITLFDKDVGDFFRKVVDDTITTREKKGIVRPDMINLLMQARKGLEKQEENGVIDTGFATAQEYDSVKTKIPTELTNEDITAQALIFFFAGFDSVSTVMCFTCYELTINPDIQEKLRQEVYTTLEDCGGKLTYEGLMKMKYMDMIISEILRKWPPSVATDRICTKPFTIEPVKPGEKPLHLEKGALLQLPIYGLHHDPEYFPNPDRFDPERFSDENKGDIKPYTYMPFGLGPRNCIGSRFGLLETKVVFFHILLNFQLVPIEKTEIPLRLSRKSFNMTTDAGFWVGLKRIKSVPVTGNKM